MTKTNEDFLRQNLHHFTTLERAFYLRGLNVHERDGMQRIMGEEFAPNYRADLTCPSCVADMVKLLYRSYFNYLKAKFNDTTVYKDISEGIERLMNMEDLKTAIEEIEQPIIIKEVEPITYTDLGKVHASFPSNLPAIRGVQFQELKTGVKFKRPIENSNP